MSNQFASFFFVFYYTRWQRKDIKDDMNETHKVSSAGKMWYIEEFNQFDIYVSAPFRVRQKKGMNEPESDHGATDVA